MSALFDKSSEPIELRFRVAVHGMIALGLLVSLVWPIPNYLNNFSNFLDTIPNPFMQAIAVSRFACNYSLYLLAALPILSWLDLKLSRFVLRCMGTRAAAWWSATVFVLLGAFIVWLLDALAFPNTW